ncbi:hypothetical protein BJV82DRAFT_670967 [Fennellomyces sp. T-0311]|nr:hypothetical protein BJV82DRAFT_670967 [Fennellomyces sp. T-0311]
MARQSIEFFLHPPSPPRPEEPCVVLPPVSSLLRDAPLSPPPAPIMNQPQINADTDLVEPLPALTLSIPSTSSAFSSPATSPYPLDTPQSSPISSPHPGLLLPPPCNTRRCRSLSNASTCSSISTCSLPSRRLSDPPLYSAIDHHHHDPSTSWQRPHSASPSLSPASPPPPFVAKRKRGRPPNASRQVSQRDCWTFVTPTVWEVKNAQLPEKDDDSSDSSSNMTVLLWPEEPRRNKGLNTFTSTRMETTLSIPKKKRGRKPKVQLAGNSCFVWRDLTARRGANRKHRQSDEDRLARRVEGIKLNHR